MPSASRLAKRACDALFAALVAPHCAACHRPLPAPTDGPVCETCWRNIPPLIPPCCSTCGDALASWRVLSIAEGRCARCRRRQTVISRTRALGTYDGALRAIVHALKYDGRRSLAARLSAMMRIEGASLLDGADLVVPVPLHWARRWSRGFNQAADLSRGLGVPVSEALRRTRNTSSQAELPAGRRHANVRAAFRLTCEARVRGACIVLVDDVSTTGATLEACGRTLLAGGAREVRALIAARAVSRARRVPLP
jgi:ComF family protein